MITACRCCQYKLYIDVHSNCLQDFPLYVLRSRCFLFVVLVFLVFFLALVLPFLFFSHFVAPFFMDCSCASSPSASFFLRDGSTHSVINIYPDMDNTWMLAASVQCMLLVISRRYMIVDLRNIRIRWSGLELNSEAPVVAAVRVLHCACLNGLTHLLSVPRRRSLMCAASVPS